MPKLPSFVLSLISFSIAQAQSFPLPAAGERAVAEIVRTGAAGAQANPRAATNGDLTLVAWVDSREGPNAGVIYAARIDAQGNVLDPLGVRIQNGGWVNAVVWNGESFVIVMDTVLAFVTADLTVTIAHPDVAPFSHFVAATPGPDARFLYLTDVAVGSRATLVDSHGVSVARKDIPKAGGTPVGTGTSYGFLILGLLYDSQTHITAIRLDRDGNVLSSRESGLPVTDAVPYLAGDDDGFLLIRAGQGLVEYRLNANGVFTGQVRILDLVVPTSVSLLREGNRYLVAYQTQDAEAIAEIGLDDSLAIHRLTDLSGTRRGVAVISDAGHRVLVSSVDRPGFGTGADLFSRPLTAGLDPGEARLITASATFQANADVADGVNGFAVAWGETGPDANTHIYVRRFSASGVPQDPAPLAAYNLPVVSTSLFPMRPTIVSNGETYLVAWFAGDGQKIRRLSARTGDWLDPIPLPLGMKGNIRLASNGVDALALAQGLTGETDGMTVRRINMTGDPLTSPGITIRKLLPGQAIGDVALASNGTDYLAVWIDTVYCIFPCSVESTRIFGTRLRADGTVLDAAPISLDNDKRFQISVDIASVAGLYLVTWSSTQGPRGTRVSAEGAVLDRDADAGAVLLEQPAGTNENIVEMPVRMGNRFALFGLHRLFPRTGGEIDTLNGVTFDPATDLATAAAMPRLPLPHVADGAGASLAAASHGGTLAVAYDRIAEGDAGGVHRAFLRLLLEPPPRRRASPH